MSETTQPHATPVPTVVTPVAPKANPAISVAPAGPQTPLPVETKKSKPSKGLNEDGFAPGQDVSDKQLRAHLLKQRNSGN